MKISALWNRPKTWALAFYLLSSIFYAVPSGALEEGFYPPPEHCACLGETVVYRCNVRGVGNTQWHGSAFDCATNDVILRHNRYTELGGVMGECNNGIITGNSIGVENDIYVSEIRVDVVEGLLGGSISCTHNEQTRFTPIGTANITTLNTTEFFPLSFSESHLYPRENTLVFDITSPCRGIESSLQAGTGPGLCNQWQCSTTRLSSHTSQAICYHRQLETLLENAVTCQFNLTTAKCGLTRYDGVTVDLSAIVEEPTLPAGLLSLLSDRASSASSVSVGLPWVLLIALELSAQMLF